MSDLTAYYEQVKLLARQKKAQYLPEVKHFGLREVKKIYSSEGIKIYYQDGDVKKLRAAYFNDEDGIDVLLNKRLPPDQRLFALIHELKHHFTDADKLRGVVACYDREPHIEKSGDVFAAEFLWSESTFKKDVQEFGITAGNCTPEIIVRFKKHHNMPVSYKFIRKRLAWLGIIAQGAYENVKFTNLEYQIYGQPFYLRYR